MSNSNDNVPNAKEVNEVAAAVVESAVVPPVKPVLKKYTASVHCGPDKYIPTPFAQGIACLKEMLGVELWLIVQNGTGPYTNLDDAVYDGIFAQRGDIGESSALLIDSAGGQAATAFKIARLFQRRASRFCIVVPKYAKSAATLLAMGAKRLILGEDAELGPLDVQMFDFDREEFGSALNAVQSLERINAFSLAVIDQMTPLLMRRTGRKLDMLLPLVVNYTVSFVRPLLEKIDTVDFTKKSRELKVAEEYAFRLLKPNYDFDVAKRIAGHLVDHYPTHGFVIDRDESQTFEMHGTEQFGLGLKTEVLKPEVQGCINNLVPFLDRLTVIGRIVEVEP